MARNTALDLYAQSQSSGRLREPKPDPATGDPARRFLRGRRRREAADDGQCRGDDGRPQRHGANRCGVHQMSVLNTRGSDRRWVRPYHPTPMTDSRYPIAVLVSGTGSNLQAIIDASERPDYSAEIVVVVSDRPDVKALVRASTARIATEIVAWSDFDSREAFTTAICDVVEHHGAEAMILAGFMRVLAPVAIERFPNRILNIHPSLLPSFPGAHAVRETLDHGAKMSGVTVHFVDEEVDHGAIIRQEAVRVLPDDDETTLHARIQEVEHRIYPEVIDALGRGVLT
jgi:phosphoribosylglycinamide formyltransferase 1